MVALTTYSLYSSALIIDLSAYTYTQTPLCNFSVSKSFAWNIPAAASSFIAQVNQSASISVQSNKKASVDSFSPVVMTTTITDNNESPAQTFTTTVSFSVVVTDPCDT